MKISNYINRKWDRIFPYLFAAVMPWLSILSNVSNRESLKIGVLAFQWLVSFGLLLSLWFAIAYVIRVGEKKFPKIKLAAALVSFVAICTVLVSIIANARTGLVDYQPLWLSAFRLSIGALIIVAIQVSFRAIRENDKLKMENFALQTENYKAQLAQLRNQVNPHFLFNSLSTLQTLIRKDPAKSEDFVHNLSDVYRELLKNRESNFVTLREELKFLNTYLYLLKTRHGNALDVKIKVEESFKVLRLPSFALQLVVENCTKHNVLSKDSPLLIQIEQSGKKIRVSNNLQPKKAAQSTGVGIENLKKRYALMDVEEGVTVLKSDSMFKVDLKLF